MPSDGCMHACMTRCVMVDMADPLLTGQLTGDCPLVLQSILKGSPDMGGPLQEEGSGQGSYRLGVVTGCGMWCWTKRICC